MVKHKFETPKSNSYLLTFPMIFWHSESLRKCNVSLSLSLAHRTTEQLVYLLNLLESLRGPLKKKSYSKPSFFISDYSRLFVTYYVVVTAECSVQPSSTALGCTRAIVALKQRRGANDRGLLGVQNKASLELGCLLLSSLVLSGNPRLNRLSFLPRGICHRNVLLNGLDCVVIRSVALWTVVPPILMARVIP